MNNNPNNLGMTQAEMQIVLPWILGNDIVIWPERLAQTSMRKQPTVQISSILQTKVSAFYDYIPAKHTGYQRGWQAGIQNIWFKKDITLWEVVQLIKGDKFRERTLALRGIKDKVENRRYKQKYFSYATFSGTFKKRDRTALIQHSQCVCIDLDDLLEIEETRANIIENVDMSHFVFMFTSPNGNGLKVLFHDHALQPDNQEKYYLGLSNYLADICKLPKKAFDTSCKDVSRACFLPHDPEIFINPRLIKP